MRQWSLGSLLIVGCVTVFPACHKPPAVGSLSSGVTTPLPVQGGGWAQSSGEATPSCTLPPFNFPQNNPSETNFVDLNTGGGPGVEFDSASNTATCCACAARQKTWAINSVNTNSAHLQGWFQAGRGPADQFSVGSMRVDLLSGGTEVAHATYAAENRANDNCTFEFPERLLTSGASFDIPLSSIAGNTQIDGIRILLQGYGCNNATESVQLANLSLAVSASGPNGAPCASNADCSSGACVSNVCCGSACQLPNASSACPGGVCTLTGCNNGFANCDGNPFNGCERDVSSDPSNCGGCGVVCGSAAPFCVGGSCTASQGLPVQGGGWAPSSGEATASCTQPPFNLPQNNPSETGFADVNTGGGPGVQFDSASNTCACCACAARQKSWSIPAGNTNGLHLQGWFQAGRGATDATSVGSMRVDLLSGGNAVAHATYAAENRANDNCTFEFPERLLTSGASFDIALSSIAANTPIDGIRILLQGYGCCTATESVQLASVSLRAVSNPNGAACTAGSDCASSFCAGNVCCASTCAPVANTTLSCATGTCVVQSCAAGFGDCDGNAANGCETALLAIPNCGACGATCNDNNACTNDVCNVAGALGVCANVNLTACGQGCGPAVGCGFLDTDGDGLNDTWETQGYVDLDCNGVFDNGVDTPLPGANVNEPDVYVKWDYLVKGGAGGHSHQPTAAAMAMVQSAYAAHHSHLHFFPANDAIPENLVVSLAGPGALPACVGADAVSFYALKTAHFPVSLRPVYHYAVFAHYNTCDSMADCATCPATAKSMASPRFGLSGIAELPGNDFVVSVGGLVDAGVNPIPDLVNAGTFMHELGHNLSLRHGGNDDLIQKPNYLSVMNYSYQFGIGATTAPGPYASSTVDPSSSYHIDYSAFAAGPLHEGVTNGMNGCISDGSGGMSEPAGVLSGPAGDTDVAVFYDNAGGTSVFAPSNGTPVDWDDAAPATDLHVYGDVSGDGVCSVLDGYDDWAQATPAPGVFQDSQLALGFQCNTGFWADGVALPGQIEDREITAQQALAQHRLYPFKHVSIQVRPGCGAKWIALSGPGTVPVVAYGSADFDVSQVVQSTLRFAGEAPATVTIADVNGDGFNDLTAIFLMSGLHLSPSSSTASLTGALASSQAFGGTDAIVLVPDPDPVVTTQPDDIYEDEPAFTAIEQKLKQCTNPPVLSFSLADCVASAVDRCGNALDPAKAGQITRVEWWANIRARDAANPLRRADALREAQERFDEEGCPKLAITSPTSANLPFERLDDLEGRSSFYKIHFTITDALGSVTAASCQLNIYGSHREQAGLARRPGLLGVPLSCAVCIGGGCGSCASPATACGESMRECIREERRCRHHNVCGDYNERCTATCRHGGGGDGDGNHHGGGDGDGNHHGGDSDNR